MVNSGWELGGQEMIASLATPGQPGTLTISIHPNFFEDSLIELGDEYEDDLAFAALCCACVGEVVRHRETTVPVMTKVWNYAVAETLTASAGSTYYSVKNMMRRELEFWLLMRRAKQRLAVADVRA